jgi:hypothetical protein
VQRLTETLGARAFHKPKEWVFFDQTGLKTGDEFSPKLERAARRSAVMISRLSNSYLQAHWCIRETEWLDEAARLARDPIERRLIPLVLNPLDLAALRNFPRFQKLLRGDVNPGRLESLTTEITTHLNAARLLHGSVFSVKHSMLPNQSATSSVMSSADSAVVQNRRSLLSQTRSSGRLPKPRLLCTSRRQRNGTA